MFALVLATLVEGTVEYVLGKYEKARPFLLYVALALGVAVAFAYKIDLLAQVVAILNLGGIALAPAWVGYIASGVIIGRGSNYLNDFVSSLGRNSTTVTSPANAATKTTIATAPIPPAPGA